MAATTPTPISPLRQRMLDALQLRGMAPRTQETYIDAVSRLARHYHRSPDLLSADEVQAYLLHLLRERHLARASLNLYGCAFRFEGYVLRIRAGRPSRMLSLISINLSLVALVGGAEQGVAAFSLLAGSSGQQTFTPIFVPARK